MVNRISRVALHPIASTKWKIKTIRWKWQLIRDPRYCYACKRQIPCFLPYRGGVRPGADFRRALAMVGSDLANFSCIECGCHDRTRHLLMYFDKLNLWSNIRGGAVLHIAPEIHVSPKIQDLAPAVYVKGDLFPSAPGIEKVDITDLQFEDNFFDFIICNHVLEHVPYDRKALSEFYRTLKPGGHAVLQTPFARRLEHSFCDPGINTDDLRERFYAQEDHVRLYGMDLFSRMEETGFKLQIKKHRDLLPEFDPQYYGVNPEEELILVEK